MPRLMLAELLRAWRSFIRYPGNRLAGVVSFTILFVGLFLGARYASGPGTFSGSGLDAVIVGYVIWNWSLFALGTMAWSIQTEAQVGTLEQVYLSPAGPIRILLARAVADAALQFGVSILLLAILLLLTGRTVHVSPIVTLPTITFLMGVYGLGFVLAALTLIFKQISGLINIFQYLLILLTVVPVEALPGVLATWGALLPIVPSAGLLRQIMARGEPVAAMQALTAILNGLVYLIVGLLVYRWVDNQVRRRGLLGVY